MLLTFVVGLLLSLNWVAGLPNGQANLDIWDIDISCAPYRPVLQKAYNDVAIMAAKALKDIQFVQQPRPQHYNQLHDQIEWDRVARAVENMFGFVPDKAGTDPENEYLIRILGVYGDMNKALHGDVNLPPGGFSGLHVKGLWMCGDESWKWYTKEMSDPYVSPVGHPLYISRPNIFAKTNGAWVYKERFITNGDPRSVGICRSNVHASTQVRFDMITFCQSSFTEPTTHAMSPVDGRNSVVEEKTKLDDFGRYSLSRIMFHELVHWYGAKKNPNGMIDRLPDQQAVSKKGELIWGYKNEANELKFTATSGKKPETVYNKAVVYYYNWCAQLARSYPGSEFAQISGPAKATETAEAYAYFAMMAYLDNFDWTVEGEAKKVK